ncbi:MAG TPA: ATP-binding protein [Candidatus Binataceae bacterium]|nr:ATP-binding protein [Candidatus Binataceae bacterium]
MTNGIIFQVETTRVLEILTREIYDSPLALIRENLQNAYDAVRMRFAKSGSLVEGGRIDIRIGDGEISIADNGIGMTERVLRENFWKAGSSGKHSDDARRAGVVGTFGIGAMANFGVCTRLTVETMTEGSTEALRSVAERDALKIAEECISLERVVEGRDIGTTVIATLDADNGVSADQAKRYLLPYVGLLPVPVYLNDELISGNSIESQLRISARQFTQLGAERRRWTDNSSAAKFDVRVDPNGQVLVYVTEVSLSGASVEGGMTLLQAGSQLMGLRSYFGLAPIPAIGPYQFGGFANLSFLQPTAGREALSRESISQVTSLVGLAEWATSRLLAKNALADRNNAFLQWIKNNKQFELAGKVLIRALPEERDVPLSEIKSHAGTRTIHYYTGVDRHIIATFANESTCLLQVVQGNPRRDIQLRYVVDVLGIGQVPDQARVTRIYEVSELTAPEASVILHIASILRDDYLVPDVQPVLADISHQVSILPVKEDEQLKLYISRSSTVLAPLLELYGKAYRLFDQFMKDFVRVQIYHRIQQYVPSSTRGGVEALRKILERNRELYRYEETEVGDLAGELGEYLRGERTLGQILRGTYSRNRSQSQSVSAHQIGSVENEIPGVIDSPVSPPVEEDQAFSPNPPIVRASVTSNMKILTTFEEYPPLNGFKMLLGLSDSLMRSEADFFRIPHTTRILWGGHRIVYIFTESTGQLNLYYDIELREPVDPETAGGGMFPTTTLITKNRIFVPVPQELASEFKVTGGPKEFFVRFDILSTQTE